MQHHAIGTSANMPDKDKPSVEENGDFVAVHNPLLCYVHYLLHSHDDHEFVRVEALSKFPMIVLWRQKGHYGTQTMPVVNFSKGKILPNEQQRKDSAKRTAKERFCQTNSKGSSPSGYYGGTYSYGYT